MIANSAGQPDTRLVSVLRVSGCVGRLRLRLALRRVLVGLVMADNAARRSARDAMPSRHVSGHSSDRRSLQASLRLSGRR